MRKTILTMAALSAAAIMTTVTSGPAAAYDYPWCAQGKGVGVPGDCSYQTYGQCMASASGREPLLQHQSTRRLRPRAAGASALSELLLIGASRRGSGLAA